MIDKHLYKYTIDVKRGIIQFIKFGLVGISNTLLSYGMYMLGIYLGMHYIYANLCGFIISIINSFFWNSRYVFQKSEERFCIIKTFFKMFLSYVGTGFVLSSFLLLIQINILGIEKWMAPLINLVITVPLNFVLNKFWVFKD